MAEHQTASFQDSMPDRHSERNIHPHINGSDMFGCGRRHSHHIHIKCLAGRCFYQLRQLRSIRRSRNTDAKKTLVNAFISSRVDYCNSVFNGAGAVHLHPIQSVLNASARLIVKKRKFDQITATIRDELHWLPVQQRLDYKLCNFIYKCFHHSAPSYLSSVCIRDCEIEGRRTLRSAARGDQVVLRTNNKTYGRRCFAVAGPSV